MPDAFRDLVVRELTQVIIENACDRTERHAVRVAEAIADRLTCPDCGFIDIGIGNPPNNVCNDCAPAPRHWRTTLGVDVNNLKRCLAETDSGLPQAPYLYCTLPEGHDGGHEATDLRTGGEIKKTWPKAPWELGENDISPQ